MKKEEAVRIISECANQYKENLENNNVLFIIKDKETNKINYIETLFYSRNFLHLTGVEMNNKKLSSTDFYKKAVKGQLRPDEFTLTSNGTTEVKLQVLSQLMNIHKVAKMVGDYNLTKAVLHTEKLVGTITASLGFIKEGSYYIPNTALKEDTRNITKSPNFRVLAIFRKSIKEQLYGENTYVAKNIELKDLDIPEELKNKILFS